MMGNINICMQLLTLFFPIFQSFTQMEIIKMAVIHQRWHPVTTLKWLKQIDIQLINCIPLVYHYSLSFIRTLFLFLAPIFLDWNDESKSKSL
jgi:hypothetical protein